MQNFTETEADFFQYLVKYGNVNSHSRTNYMSWLNFLSKEYKIDNDLTIDLVNNIIQQEKEKRLIRNVYKKEKDISNFNAALKKYLAFLSFDLPKVNGEVIKSEIENIEKNNELSVTEKSSIILSRVGQGRFRTQLITYWNGCSITTFNKLDILVASHIKPWKDANNFERIDLFNGLLLLPNYDKLFDRGYISFDKKGRIIYSRFISDTDKKILGMDRNLSLIKIEERHKNYLTYHHENHFMG